MQYSPSPDQSSANERPFELIWNALVNRAQAILRARASCREQAELCSDCVLASSPTACRKCFRDAQVALYTLAKEAPAPHRYQLRRTVDASELAYRSTPESGEAL